MIDCYEYMMGRQYVGWKLLTWRTDDGPSATRGGGGGGLRDRRSLEEGLHDLPAVCEKPRGEWIDESSLVSKQEPQECTNEVPTVTKKDRNKTGEPAHEIDIVAALKQKHSQEIGSLLCDLAKVKSEKEQCIADGNAELFRWKDRAQAAERELMRARDGTYGELVAARRAAAEWECCAKAWQEKAEQVVDVETCQMRREGESASLKERIRHLSTDAISQDPNVGAVVSYLDSHPGSSQREILGAKVLPFHATRKALLAAQGLGLVERRGEGPNSGYHITGSVVPSESVVKPLRRKRRKRRWYSGITGLFKKLLQTIGG